VNVFGVPLSISETGEGGEAPPPPKPTTQIEVVPDRAHLELRWPNVLRTETVVKPELTIDWSKVRPLVIDRASTSISAELAPALGGATDMGMVTATDLEKLPDGVPSSVSYSRLPGRRLPSLAAASPAPVSTS
jgi:type III restriction enzyme